MKLVIIKGHDGPIIVDDESAVQILDVSDVAKRLREMQNRIDEDTKTIARLVSEGASEGAGFRTRARRHDRIRDYLARVEDPNFPLQKRVHRNFLQALRDLVNGDETLARWGVDL